MGKNPSEAGSEERSERANATDYGLRKALRF
jgi:hypothetical protein